MLSCETKYPVLLVHGMGFRDRKIFNYWGRIPKELENRGCKVFYGHQDANGTIENNSLMIKKSLDKALIESGSEKVNIIAHSKGGLDARYLISSLGEYKKVASLSTVDTPHHGSQTVDFLLKFPDILVKATGKITDFFMYICGDSCPESYQVFQELTTDYLEKFNIENPDMPDIYYQSYGFFMKNIFSDIVMSFPYSVIKSIEHENTDGLLTERAMNWTNFRGMFTSPSRRGISHCDTTDLRRRRFTKKMPDNEYEIADIVDFYIRLVAELKEKGF
ncbi:MAG: hypothetical protein K2G63_00235 [Oscillospiraceae bacterium]|nr:hypothetical protein [Oscillospiraceae bacterium]